MGLLLPYPLVWSLIYLPGCWGYWWQRPGISFLPFLRLQIQIHQNSAHIHLLSESWPWPTSTSRIISSPPPDSHSTLYTSLFLSNYSASVFCLSVWPRPHHPELNSLTSFLNMTLSLGTVNISVLHLHCVARVAIHSDLSSFPILMP